MKAQDSIGKETVQRRPATVPVVCKLSVGLVPRDAQLLPSLNISIRDVLEGKD